MNVIIHIGQSKTGTTALQTSLSRNRRILEEHKILYPDVFLQGKSISAMNHNPFVDSFGGYLYYPYLSAEEYWKQFTKQYSEGDYDTMLLSGESFFGGRPYIWEVKDAEDYYNRYRKNLEKLKEFLGDANVTVVGYMRPQIQWLQSAIPHIIRYEGTLGCKVYESDEQVMNLLEPSMNYYHLIGLWEEVIKPSTIKLKPYDRNELLNQNVIEDFLQQIELSDSRLDSTHASDNAHDSWSREFVELKQKINQEDRTRIQEDTIIDTINYLDKKHGSRKKYDVPVEMKENVYRRYEAGNTELSNKYNGGKPFFPPEKISSKDLSVSKEDVQRVTEIYDAYKASWPGKKVWIVAVVRRTLKKTSPALFSIVSRIWKKVKKSSIRAV